MTARILVLSPDDARRTAIVDALTRRFGDDYDVVAAASDEVTDAFVVDPVALALAPIGTAEAKALRVVSAKHPTARRIAIVELGDSSVHHQLNREMTLGHIDYHVGHPWASPDEELYPVLSEALRVWAYAERLRLTRATIVHAPNDERGVELSTFLERNGVANLAHESTSARGTELLGGALAGLALPAVQLWDGRALAAPSDAELAAALGAPVRPELSSYDIAIVGSGPAGLAAATYASSEGMSAVAIEGSAVGGQAGTSAKIRNYLGFPWGIRGVDLAAQAGQQAEQLGAELVVANEATALHADGDDRVLTLSSGDVIRARAVILAGGVNYRRTGVASVDALVGHGVFYGAAAGEAASMGGLRVAILGGGNSAGQAAANLAAAGASVSVLIRGDSLGKSMSEYLVEQLEGTPSITVLTQSQVTDAVGHGHLTGLVLQHAVDGPSTIDVDALFIFIGAAPHTDWLAGAVDLDDHGFVLTGQNGAPWLATSMPGVFAAGDIRAGSIKRVAAAVGEGSTAAMLAHDLLKR